MQPVNQSDPREYFCSVLGVNIETLKDVVKKAEGGAEDGELYLERVDSESVSLSEGRVESPVREIAQGFGLRRVNRETIMYASGSNLTLRAIERAGKAMRAVSPDRQEYIPTAPTEIIERYEGANPLNISLTYRVNMLRAIDRYARRDPMVTNVSASLAASHTRILIVRADGTVQSDRRPMTRLSISVQLADDGKSETGGASFGGRQNYGRVLDPLEWMPQVDKALADAHDLLRAEECPSGEMTVVLGSGWAGVLLHEAIGHGLEGDTVWRKETVFADKLGTRIASDLVTVVDDGTLPERRGSLTIDDEGVPTERTTLIEKGMLRGFMHDRQSARLLGMKPTGNGRRESYEYRPQARMRNTFMLSGETDPAEIIRATKSGLYMPSFGGGQVNPITGEFVFKAELAYKIEDGVVTTPVVGATLVGNCATVLMHVDMVGNDMALDPGTGTCGKGGQGVPVGVGQPTIRLSGGVSVGGTLAKTSTKEAA